MRDFFLTGGLGLDPRTLQVDDPGGDHVDEVRLVGGEHDGEPALALGLQPGGQPRDALDVEALLRLVEHEQLAWPDESRRECQPAALPRGQGAGQLARLGDELHLVQDLVDRGLGVGDAMGPRQQVEVLDDGQVGEEVEVVDHGGQVAADLGVRFAHPHTVQLDAARVGAVGTHEAAQDRGLAGAVAAGQRHRLAGEDLEVEVVDHHDGPEDLAEVGGGEERTATGHGVDSPTARQARRTVGRSWEDDPVSKPDPRATLAKRRADVALMFDTVASRYDLMNDVLSLGQHRRWRTEVVTAIAPQPGERVLDLAAGTGSSSRPFADAGALVVPTDLSLGMVTEGKRRQPDLGFVNADALSLPFADDTFDAVTISYGLRNVEDTEAALTEMRRVTRPGGRLVVLEFSTPTWRPFREVYRRYLVRALPVMSGVLSSNPRAYDYLAESILAWPDQAALAAVMARSGWRAVEWKNLSGGIVALHRGVS